MALPYQVAPLYVLPTDRSESVPPLEALLENQLLQLQYSLFLKSEQQHCNNNVQKLVYNINRGVLLSAN